MIAQPLQNQPIVDETGKMTVVHSRWAQAVTQLQPLSGEGSPEGLVDAKILTFYVDLIGSAGGILYVKQYADIGGDRKMGWTLV